MANTTRKNERRVTKRPPRKGPTLTRTKRLLLAALRVWELKHGIHEPAIGLREE
jgi:hypothetical protein